MPTEAQGDFSGGMISRLSPERLPENAYSYAKNIEVRDGTPRTRRGSVRLYGDIAGESFQGAGVFIPPFRADKVETILVAQGQKVYRMSPPLERVEMTLPGTLTEGPVRFVQGLETMYLFQGENQAVWEWDGRDANPFTVVEDPTDGGKNLVGTDRVTFAHGRFWMATERDTVQYSDILSTSVPLAQSFNINMGEGETVNAVFQIGGGKLIIAKDRSLYVVNNANNFSNTAGLTVSDALSRTIGVFAQDTIIQPGADTWFLSREGVYSLSVNAENNLRLADIAISDAISDRFKQINWSNAHLSQGIWFDNYYLLAVPVGGLYGSESNTTIFAFDFLTRAWVSEWEIGIGDADGVPTSTFAISRFLRSNRIGVNRLYAINELGGVMELLRDDLKDNHSPPDRYVDFSSDDDTSLTRTHASAPYPDHGLNSTLRISFRMVDLTPRTIMLYRLGDNYDDKSFMLWIQVDGEVTWIRATYYGASYYVYWDTFFSPSNYGLDIWDGEWHELVALYRSEVTGGDNGCELKLDANDEPNQVWADQTDTEIWFDSIPAGVDEKVGYDPFIPVGVEGFSGHIKKLEILGPNGRYKYLADDVTLNPRTMFTMNEGTGTDVYDLYSATNPLVFGPTAPSWGGTAPAPANIETTFISRGYGALSVLLDGSNPKIEYTVAHANPNITSTLIGPKPFEEQVLIPDLTYDKKKYEVDNKTDWDSTNTNSDHDSFGREDYPPIALVRGESFLLAKDEEVTMGIEARHTFSVAGNIHAPWMRLKIENKQGRLDLIDIVLTTDEQPVHTGRGL